MKSFNLALNKKLSFKHNPAFTIVELLIVIVIIGILAAITIVSFGGVTSRANQAALQSDLDANSRKLQLYFTQYGSYPTTLDGSNCPTAPVNDTNYCLKASSGTTLTYQVDTLNTSEYSLYATKGTNVYKIITNNPPVATTLSTPCPTGFIVVPGSTTYGTSDFCVMKYEAKCASTSALSTGLTTATNIYNNSTTACTAANSRAVVSVASGNPISNITQTDAITYSSTASGCTGCKLITEAEWLTLAQNVLSNPMNWSGNSVGSGFIYSGHNDGIPNTSLPASDDSNGYFSTGQTSGSQKRTLTLTNGETIWDMAGNVWDWTAGQKTGGQPTGTGYSWREWTAVSGGTILPSPFPSTTGLTGASTWTSTNGIGMILSDSADNTLRAFARGGWASSFSNAGVLTLALNYTPTTTAYSDYGFRVSR